MDEADQKEIADLFYDAIATFPFKHQEAARRWLEERQAAHQVVKQLCERGLSALFEE